MCRGTAGIKHKSSVILICSGCAKILENTRENSKLCYHASRLESRNPLANGLLAIFSRVI